MGSLAFPVQCWFRFLNKVRLRRLGVGYSLSDIDLEVVYEEPAVKLATNDCQKLSLGHFKSLSSHLRHKPQSFLLLHLYFHVTVGGQLGLRHDGVLRRSWILRFCI